MTQDLFSSYLSYTEGGETPTSFNRWSLIAGIAALLERNEFLQFGHGEIYPNMYTMLIGNAGTRKSTAIKLMRKLLQSSGYTTIAAERTSKEKFLHDLARPKGSDDLDIVDQNLFGGPDESEEKCSPMLIAADEANDFFGYGNTEFLSILGTLWDAKGIYENRYKTSASDYIPNPTISILSGNTPTGFSQAFPSSIVGQGFFSRLLLIYGEPNGKRVTIPRTPSIEETTSIVAALSRIRGRRVGLLGYGPGAFSIIDRIYQTHVPIDDPRFESYSNRRIIHLLKLCIIVTASRSEDKIMEEGVIQANTYLTYIEGLMLRALSEFGDARNSAVAHKILQYISSQYKPVTIKDIWKQVSNDIEDTRALQVIITKLLYADKIQTVDGGRPGFLPVRKQVTEEKEAERSGLVDFDRFLSQEELVVKA